MKNTREPAGLLRQLTLILLTTVPFTIYAEWRSGPLGSVYINLPAGWKVLELKEDKVTASNKAEEAFFILRYYDGARFSERRPLDDFVRGELGAEAGGGEAFVYAGREASFGKVQFLLDGEGQSGFLLTVEGHDIDLSAVVFTSASGEQAYRDMLISVLDSVSIGHSSIVQPGPVSSYESPYPSERDELYSFEFEDSEVPVVMGSHELDASQELIEREARLLSLYGGTEYAVKAWKRYYRLLYRDLYARTAPIFTSLRHHVFDGKETENEIAERLLRWVQTFEYRRIDTMSDCISPLKAAVGKVGDCDSRGLLYVILLHYFDIDAILMVSSIYAHSMAAVDIEGKGARFPLDGTEYLVAETTDDVDIGRIDRSMSNTNAWIGIDFIRFSGTTIEPEGEMAE